MTRLDDYELVAELGTANYGTLYSARAPARLGLDDPAVVVKVLDRRADDYEFRRIGNELRLLAQLDSPYLVEPLDVGYGDGVLYYVMRAGRDGTLADHSPAPVPAAAGWIADAARGAHALHELGVAHRDIKPANIQLDGLRARLVDLGLAQILPGAESSAIGPRGTLEYLAPELVLGEVAGRASDVWSLAVSLHRAVTGRSCYPDLPADDLGDALRHLARTGPRLADELPADLTPILERATAADPSDRHPTAEALADELDRLADREDAP